MPGSGGLLGIGAEIGGCWDLLGPARRVHRQEKQDMAEVSVAGGLGTHYANPIGTSCEMAAKTFIGNEG